MSELIDRQALLDSVYKNLPMIPSMAGMTAEEMRLRIAVMIENAPAVSPWHRVEDDKPDEKADAIFCYEWTGISGTVYRETSIISLGELIALGCRPIAWMEKPDYEDRI